MKTQQSQKTFAGASPLKRTARCAVIVDPAFPFQRVSRKRGIWMVAACKPLLWIVWPVPGCIYTFAHLPGLQGVPLPLLLTHVDTARVSTLSLS